MKKYIKLKEMRLKNNYTLARLAKKLGITKQYLWDLEEGRRILSYKLAYKISTILNSKPDEIFLNDNKKK